MQATQSIWFPALIAIALGSMAGLLLVGAQGRDSQTKAPGLVAGLSARPWLQRALWGTFSVLVVAYLAYNLRDNTKPAQSSNLATGGAAPMGGSEAVSQAELEGLKDRLQQNPNDVDALLRISHLALRAQEFQEAEFFNRRAQALMPHSLEARVHTAMLLAKDGDTETAIARIDELNREDPGFAEAWFFRGMIGMQQGDMDAMRMAFQQFIKVAPNGPQKDRVRMMLERNKT